MMSKQCRLNRLMMAALGTGMAFALAAAPAFANESRLIPKLTKVIDIDANGSPYGAGASEVDINRTTNRIYVPNINASTISVFDGAADKLIATIPIPSKSCPVQGGNLNGPASMAIDEKSNTLYLLTNNGCILTIDGTTNKIKSQFVADTTPIPGLAGPDMSQVVYSNKTGKLYAINYQTQIDVVDAEKKKVLKVIPDNDANYVAINQKTNMIYVSNNWGADIWAIDGNLDDVANVISYVGTPSSPDGCWVVQPPPSGCTVVGSQLDLVFIDEGFNRAYGLAFADGTFATVDLAASAVTSRRTIDSHEGFGAVDQSDHGVYALDYVDSVLSVVDGVTGKVVAQNIPIGPTPSPANCVVDCVQTILPIFVAVNPNTGKVYVATDGNLLLGGSIPSQLFVFQKPK
jgi:DNA-binding beta-propeller fold protein YncE